jgi:hypothetical protein
MPMDEKSQAFAVAGASCPVCAAPQGVKCVGEDMLLMERPHSARLKLASDMVQARRRRRRKS